MRGALHSKLAISWPMHHHQDWQMVIRTVEVAIWQRQGGLWVALHSERGSQFTSADYRHFLSRSTLAYSMIAIWPCGDNTAREGFFSCWIALHINRIELVMMRPRIFSTTSGDFIIHEYIVESPGKI